MFIDHFLRRSVARALSLRTHFDDGFSGCQLGPSQAHHRNDGTSSRPPQDTEGEIVVGVCGATGDGHSLAHELAFRPDRSK